MKVNFDCKILQYEQWHERNTILKMYEWGPLSPSAETHIWAKNHDNREKSPLNSILMLRDCVYGRLTLEVVLRYGSRELIKISSFGYKVPLWCVHTEKLQLKWIETPRIYSLVIDWDCYSFVNVKCHAHGDDCSLILLGNVFEVWRGKQWQRCQIHFFIRRNKARLAVSQNIRTKCLG